MSPKVIALVGHALWQAVTTSPSRSRTVLLVGRDMGGLDALRAIGALLHHAARAHGHVGIMCGLLR